MAWDGTRSGRPEESLVALLHEHALAATLQGARRHWNHARQTRHGQMRDGLRRRATGRQRAVGGVGELAQAGVACPGTAMNGSSSQCSARRSAKACATPAPHLPFSCGSPAARHASVHRVFLLQLTPTRPRPGRFRQMNALHPLPGSFR